MYKSILECYLNREYLLKTELHDVQYKDPKNFLPLEEIYLGPKVMDFLCSNNSATGTEKNTIRTSYLVFLVEAASQIYKRFPFQSLQMRTLKKLQFMDPKNIDKISSISTVFSNFKDIMRDEIDVNILDQEYRLLRNSTISKQQSILDFWKAVALETTGDGDKLYKNLNKFVSTILVLPHSSAAVERIFSVINNNKTKIRNRLSTETLNGILHAKRMIRECFNFQADTNMLKKHCNSMYLL